MLLPYYKLEGDDIIETFYHDWITNNPKTIRVNNFRIDNELITVTTIFHGAKPSIQSPPVLFLITVEGGSMHGRTEQATTMKLAIKTHERIIFEIFE